MNGKRLSQILLAQSKEGTAVSQELVKISKTKLKM
jgi:hypothetical protein